MLAETRTVPRPGCKKRVSSSERLLLSLRCHLITMVQPAESRKGLNLAVAHRANFCSTTSWRVLRESKMRPVLMVIEQVGRHQSFEMLLRIWISRGAPDPSRDTPFRDIETQLEQFAVNARRSPGRILGNHTEDQGANLFADTLPPSYSSES